MNPIVVIGLVLAWFFGYLFFFIRGASIAKSRKEALGGCVLCLIWPLWVIYLGLGNVWSWWQELPND